MANRKDQTYKDIVSQINRRTLNKVTGTEKYVDSYRGISVMLGDGTTTNDLKYTIKIPGMNDNKRTKKSNEICGLTYLKQAEHLMKKKFFSQALLYLDAAAEKEPTSPVVYTNRAKCHLHMGNWQLAKIDAETVLSEDKKFSKAILTKAESLYYSRQFEHALMFYHRGKSLTLDGNDFRLGIQNCSIMILNTLGHKNVFQIPEIETVVTKWSSDPRNEESLLTQLNKGNRPRMSKFSQRLKLFVHICNETDRLIADKEYLTMLATPDVVGRHVASEAAATLTFLNERERFRNRLETHVKTKKKKKKEIEIG